MGSRGVRKFRLADSSFPAVPSETQVEDTQINAR